MRLFLLLCAIDALGQNISPATATLRPAQVLQFSVSGGPCNWGATLGTITQAGAYQAPLVVVQPGTAQISCGAGLATVTLNTGTGPGGLAWYRSAGTILFSKFSPPFYFNTSSAAVSLDFDPALFRLIPDSRTAGQQMLTLNTANLPPGPQGPPGTPGVNCTSGVCNGIVLVTNPDGTVSPSINSATTQTRSLDVQNVDHWCVDTSGVTSYMCGTGSAAAWAGPGYRAGAWVMLQPSASSFGSAWLNVNGQGLANIKLADGTTDPGTLLVAGRWYLLVFNGTVWTMSQGDSHQ